MMAGESGPRAIDGGPLHQGPLVRAIYMDEAGTSALEPVTVVAAAIINGDDQWRAAEADLAALREKHVAEEIRHGFVFHATEMMSGGKRVNVDTWDFQDRIAAVYDVLGMPARLNIPIAFGFARKAPGDNKNSAHMMAFTLCLTSVNTHMERWCGDDIAWLFAEDTQEMKQRLKGLVRDLKDPARSVPPLPESFRLSRIADAINFQEKGDAPLLQVADHAAYAIRRKLAGQSHADEMISNLHSGDLGDVRLDAPHGSGVLDFRYLY